MSVYRLNLPQKEVKTSFYGFLSLLSIHYYSSTPFPLHVDGSSLRRPYPQSKFRVLVEKTVQSVEVRVSTVCQPGFCVSFMYSLLLYVQVLNFLVRKERNGVSKSNFFFFFVIIAWFTVLILFVGMYLICCVRDGGVDVSRYLTSPISKFE